MKNSELMPYFAELLEQRNALIHQNRILNRLNRTIETNRKALYQSDANIDQLLAKDWHMTMRYHRLYDHLKTNWVELNDELEQVTRDLWCLTQDQVPLDYSKVTPEQHRLIKQEFAKYHR